MRATRLDLIRNIQDEAERLNRFIGNLLDMTRLESGPAAAAHRSRSNCPTRSAARCGAPARSWRSTARRCVLQPDLPMLDLDEVLFEQVLFNLLDNAGQVCAGRLADHHQGVAGRTARSSCRCWTRGRAFRPPIWSACSTSSTASAAPTGGVPAPGSASRSAAASSRRCTAPSPPPIAPTARARCSP